MKLDILVLSAHPDDAELGCAGTIAAHVAKGKKVGVLDLTQGELGTRGTVEIRAREAVESAKIMGLSVRENLGFADAFFTDDRTHQLKIIEKIRKYKPEIVLANATSDRHPDHGKAAQLAKKACFMAGLRKIETFDNGEKQEAWRPKAIYHYIQNNMISPDLVVDVSAYWDIKIEAIKAFKSQFYDPNSKEPDTILTSPAFLTFIEARGRELGHSVGVEFGEGFTVDNKIGVSNLFDVVMQT